MHLVLKSFGSSLQVENKQFLVTHDKGKQILHPSKIKSITISRGARISSDAAIMAIENEIGVMFVDKTGRPIGRLWSNKYGSVSKIRRKQLEFINHPAATRWIISVIKDKIENQTALIMTFDAPEREQKNYMVRTVSKLEKIKDKLHSVKDDLIKDAAPSLRGWEGSASRIYFEAVSYFLPKEYQYEGRSQHPAFDAFNCLLNYGYGMLYGKVESALIRAGIDPYLGIMHRDEYNRPVLVYDFIEKYRVWVDFVVIALCLQKAVDDELFEIKDNGAYWLAPAGKRVLINAVNDYLAEIVAMKSVNRSRENHIFLDAQKLATKFQSV